MTRDELLRRVFFHLDTALLLVEPFTLALRVQQATVVAGNDVTNNPGDRSIDDAILLADAYNSTPGGPNWNPNADINKDGVVDIYDTILLANHYNQRYP